MLPILFKIGQQPISSFGLFLLLSFLISAYTIWRLIRVYELDEEKTIDLILLTFVGGLIFARIYFVLFHLNDFNSLDKAILVNKYPGLSFWGALIGGLLTLRFFSSRLKVNFWQVADLGIIGVFAGLVVSSFGCLLGSCQYGEPSNLPIAITQIGLIGKRFPLQVIEGFLYFVTYLYLWRFSLKFHFNGQVFAKGLLFLGVFKFILEFFRGDRQILILNVSHGTILSVLLVIVATKIYYSQTKKSLMGDLRFFLNILTNSNKRRYFLSRLNRNIYSARVNSKFAVSRWRKGVSRRFNIKSNPPH